MAINDNIKRIRKERGLTQKRLGELCGIAEPNIRKYESGKQKPKLETIEKISSALGVTPFDIMGVDYWDQKMPNKAIELNESEAYEAFLVKLGYEINKLFEGNDIEGGTSVQYRIYGNGIDVVLSYEEYKRLQSSSTDLIFSYLWKKQQK